MLRQIDAHCMTNPAFVPAAPAGQAGPGGQTRATWHELTTDLLRHVAGYLDHRRLCGMARADRRTRAALAPMIQSARIDWCIGRVSNLSTLQAALREIHEGAIPPNVRARHMAALAERLTSMHPFVAARACGLMTDSVATLPADLRQRLLCALLSCCGKLAHLATRQRIVHHVEMAWHLRSLQGRLLQLACGLPAPQQAAALLALCTEFPRLTQEAAAALPACLQRAMAVPGAQHAPLIAPLITAMCWAVRSLGRAPVELLATVQSAYPALARQDGAAAMAERTAVLCAVADVAGPAWLHAGDIDLSAQVRQWVWEALRDLPGESRLRVLSRVAAWSHAGSSREQVLECSNRLWTEGQKACTDAATRAHWLAIVYKAAPGVCVAPRLWGDLWAEAVRLAPPGCAVLIASHASSLGLLPHEARRDAWSGLFRHAVDVLPIDHRAGPLQALAAALAELSGPFPDSRWDAMIDAAADLPPAGRAPVLYEFCAAFPEQCERHWDRYLQLLAQLPPDALNGELQRACDQLRRLTAAMAARAVPRLAALLQRLPADHREQPWLALWRLVGVILGPADRTAAWEALLRAMVPLPPTLEQRWLVAAAAIDHADACMLLLERAAGLPAARRASVLSELARGSVAGRPRETWLPIWQALVEAVRSLPPAYRGSPLHALRELQIALSEADGGPWREALAALTALYEGVPPIDLPPATGAPS
ncbi:hypothetical protein [Cupriavidus gilardii]|uniref:hypothetical protein n=1 Tax=Cupriavidus gilardii TaxID=82541 RepID=UPI001574722C|nr:hypothetical protein [Cupriavidus gilardii]NSX05399.1 hypothetical protein [Cupriavidus gilardii]